MTAADDMTPAERWRALTGATFPAGQSPGVSRRGRGRPEVGPSTNLRLTRELRARLDAARRPGEPVAAACRRLLAVALADVLPDALALAAASWDDVSTVGCLECGPMASGELCPAHAEALERAEACRALLAELAPRGDAP